MGLTAQSGGRRASAFARTGRVPEGALVVMAGQPNVGKSSLFNALTGLHQHTGNWTGKTVGVTVGVLKDVRRGGGIRTRSSCAGDGCAGGCGSCRGCAASGSRADAPKERVLLADLPGCCSLTPRSAEEEAARDFLLSQPVRAAVVVCDALNLERCLPMAFRLAAFLPHGRVILCVNLIDEAAHEGVTVDADALSAATGFPVVLTSARTGVGLRSLADAIRNAAAPGERDPGRSDGNASAGSASAGDGSGDSIPDESAFRARAAAAASAAVRRGEKPAGVSGRELTRRLDAWVTGRWTAIPCALLLLALTLWLTIRAANRPSAWLAEAFGALGGLLWRLPVWESLPAWVPGLMLDGVYRTVTFVVSVMLPPMAIFFPLFTLLEDFGLLPRIAFNTDRCFSSCGACGKQALTMCMGLGCTAAGVTGCRIIDSPRERAVALLTNAFMPCNGKFPTLLCMSAVLISYTGRSAGALGAALIVTALLILCVFVTLGVSRLLSATILRGTPSSFLLELPPYRVPRVGQVLLRSLLDRTLFVLGRAVTAAAPAGAMLWLAAHVRVGADGFSLLTWAARALDPVGALLCVDGAVLLALLLSFPANELTLPILLMIYSAGPVPSAADAASAAFALGAAGWSWVTCGAFLILFLFHSPCATALLTVRKEAGARRAVEAAVIPAAVGVGMCLLVRVGVTVFG